MKPLLMMSGDLDSASIQDDEATARNNAEVICGLFRADARWQRFGQLGILTAHETEKGWTLAAPSESGGTMFLTLAGFDWIRNAIEKEANR